MPPNRGLSFRGFQAQNRASRMGGNRPAFGSPAIRSSPPRPPMGGGRPFRRPFFGGGYYRPPVIVPVPIRSYGYGYGAPTVVHETVVEGTPVTEQGYGHGVRWSCNTVSEQGNMALRNIGWAMIGFVILMFIAYPLWSWFWYGLVYPEDIFAMMGIAIFVLPVAVIFLIVTMFRNRNCYQSY